MSRVYDIVLSCGCMISTDGGGACIPCFDDKNCKYFEEYSCSPNWVDWKIETFVNNCSKLPSDEVIEKTRKAFQKEYDKRLKRAYANGRLDVLQGIVEWC